MARLLLSERQEQLLMLVAQGKTYKQIAGELGLAFVSVEETIRRAMRNLKCFNTAQLVYKYYAEPFLGSISWKRRNQIMTRPDSVCIPTHKKDLTARQEQALMLVITGLSYKLAAERMGIIKGAFQHLMQRAMKHMYCTNLAQLTYKYYAEEFHGPMKVKLLDKGVKHERRHPEDLSF